MGNLTEDGVEDGGRPRRLHRPEPVPQHPHRRAQLRQADQHALLRLETSELAQAKSDWPRPERNLLTLLFSSPPSSGSEDGDVLPEDQAGRQPHPVHPEQGEAEGGPGARQGVGGGGQGAQHGRHGVFTAEPRRVSHVRFLNCFRCTSVQKHHVHPFLGTTDQNVQI